MLWHNVILWGRGGQNVILWGHKGDIYVKKAPILALSLFTLHNVLHQYPSNYLFYTKNTKKNDCIQ